MSDKMNETVTSTELELDVLEQVVNSTDEELIQEATTIEEKIKTEDVDDALDVTSNLEFDEEQTTDISTQEILSIEETVDTKLSNDEENVETTVYTVKRSESSALKAVPQRTFEQLTKKNQQYLLSVAKQLEGDHLDAGASTAVFTEIADTLIQGQKTGQTAKHLYGTPTECATIIRDQHFPKEVKTADVPSAPKYIALDGSLLLGSIYTLMTGISMMNARVENIGVGLLTLIVNYIVAGFAMLLIARNLPKPDAPKGERGYLRYFTMATLAMLSWVAAVSLTTAFIPKVINPLLPAGALIAIGALTLAARFYIKKRFNIKGGVF